MRGVSSKKLEAAATYHGVDMWCFLCALGVLARHDLIRVDIEVLLVFITGPGGFILERCLAYSAGNLSNFFVHSLLDLS